MDAIPVVLLTGFLGAGKTTLLNDLLRQPAFRATAVIINEAGAVGIDHALTAAATDEVILLEGGCICCRMRGSLNTTLNGLLRRRALDGLAFERVIIETSGLADPAPILNALIADPQFNRHFALSGVTTVVDGMNFCATQPHHGEASLQVALADRILITKADLATPAALEAVSGAVAALNPGVAQHRLAPGGRDASLIWIDPLHEAVSPARHRFSASGSSHDVATCAHTFSGRLPRAAVDAWLDRLADLFGEGLLRLKGIVWIAEMDRPVVLHGVQGLIYSPGLLDAGRVPDGENRMVLIARRIEAQDLTDALTLLARAARPEAGSA